MADEKHPLLVEPPVPIATPIGNVHQIRGILNLLRLGDFRQPALLVEYMLENPRLRAVVNTRVAGLIAAKVQFQPARNNRDARRAAREFQEDWPRIAATPMRAQFLVWAWFLGASFARRLFDESETSGRQLLKLSPYWPGFAKWYWALKSYRIQTYNRGVVDAISPAHADEVGDDVTVDILSPLLAGPSKPSDSSWVIAEPFGVNSWRQGMLFSSWRPWLGHDMAMRDEARASEKLGVGIIKAFYPRGHGDEHKDAINRFTNGLRGKMGSEGVVPLELREHDEQPGDNFDIEPFEFNGTGGEAIERTLTTCAIAMSILWLGHNLTTEVKSGGSYAAAGVGEYIRDDIKNQDAEIEWSCLGPQLARPYCELNYSDPEVTPIAVYETDSTAVNQQQANMFNLLAQAIAVLRINAPQVDIDALCERFRLPMSLADKKSVVVPAVTAPDAPAPKEPA